MKFLKTEKFFTTINTVQNPLFVFFYGFIKRNSIKRKEEERIWEKTRERAALHKERYFYGEQKYTKED